MAETATPTATPNNSAAPSAAVTSTPAQHSAAPNAAAPNAAALNVPAHETQTKPTGDAAQHNAKQPKKKKEGGIRRIIMPVLFFGVLIFAANYGYHKYVFGQNHEETDDAQVDGNIDPVLPRIAGYVTAVYVNDNQRVKDGEMLVKLDTADLLLKVSAAQAAYQNAEAAVKVAQANVFTSQVNVRKTHLDLERDTRLLAAAAISQKQVQKQPTQCLLRQQIRSPLRNQSLDKSMSRSSKHSCNFRIQLFAHRGVDSSHGRVCKSGSSCKLGNH
jgi:hypothetical protein